MNALTKSIALRPTVLAYYVRGVINLFYNAFIFHRADKGVAKDDATTLCCLWTKCSSHSECWRITGVR